MWLRHWNLDHDPFEARSAGFVATPTHAEAVARLVHTIETAGRSARLVGAPGLGKSITLARAIEATRSPGRRFARASGPGDGPELFAALAIGLGSRIALDAGRSAAWRALREAVRLQRWQNVHVVLAVDGCETLEGAGGRADLGRLDHLEPDPAARLTILRVGRASRPSDLAPDPSDWGLSIGLSPLTRNETAGYVTTKVRAAGRFEPAFTPRALARLHALAGGVPRGIGQIAGLAMIASAVRGEETVGPETVEAAGLEFTGSRSTLAGA